MLQASDITYTYNGGLKLVFPNISCPTGQHWLLLGQSGSGKTTLLHLLAGLRTPTTGSVSIGGTDISKLRASRLDKFRGKNIGIVFQEPHFMRALNVEENLALTQSLSGQKVDKKKIHTLLDRLNIAHKLKSDTSALSQGEKQRVAIARALINDPVLILADEPTSALDDKNTREVISLLEEQATAAGATLLVVTHDNRLREQFPNQITL
ncbi:MAG: ABC transporter ATP-binding protein [Bacteroidetes bacterium]|nr:MAG: ABC transporter ATP-binding protein [Bacteroidota bacterium]